MTSTIVLQNWITKCYGLPDYCFSISNIMPAIVLGVLFLLVLLIIIRPKSIKNKTSEAGTK